MCDVCVCAHMHVCVRVHLLIGMGVYACVCVHACMHAYCMTHQCHCVVCSLPADGERGVPNEQVDIQRNRIIATAALKKAEPLADQGTYMNLSEIDCMIMCMCNVILVCVVHVCTCHLVSLSSLLVCLCHSWDSNVALHLVTIEKAFTVESCVKSYIGA